MINKFKLSLLMVALLGGCKYFEPQVLDDSHQIAVEEGEQKGMPAMKLNKGYIDDFNGDIASWWSASPDLILTKKGDTLRVESKNVGSKYVPFGREIPAVDLSEYPVLKVKMRFEGNLAPDVRIDLQDIYGKSADQIPKQRLRRGGFRDYYFKYHGKWKQFWPDAQPVDPKAISKISVFINPGTADWTGTLYIDEIQIVSLDDIPEKKPRTPVQETPVEETTENKAASEVLIDDFSKGIDPWWSGNDSKVKVAKEEEMLKVEFKEAGPTYETFGRGFDKIDFTKTPVVKVRVKSQGEKPTFLRVDIKDAEGFSTNAKPIAIKLESGTDFVDYYYDFTGKFEQSFPNVQKVKPEEIVEILLFVNPGGEAYTGTLYIEEIKTMSLEDFKNKK